MLNQYERYGAIFQQKWSTQKDLVFIITMPISIRICFGVRNELISVDAQFRTFKKNSFEINWLVQRISYYAGKILHTNCIDIVMIVYECILNGINLKIFRIGQQPYHFLMIVIVEKMPAICNIFYLISSAIDLPGGPGRPETPLYPGFPGSPFEPGFPSNPRNPSRPRSPFCPNGPGGP